MIQKITKYKIFKVLIISLVLIASIFVCFLFEKASIKKLLISLFNTVEENEPFWLPEVDVKKQYWDGLITI